jgi:uncharacterized membrane protein YcaP (DUF421 family)
MQIFFDSAESLLRTIVVGVLTYATLVLFLRVSGKRTLSKMNAFDLVVTVAFGSTLATALLAKQTTLADAALALTLLVGLQFVVAWLSVRSKLFQKIIKSEPRLLFFRGEFLEENLRRERVVREEIFAAIRSEGVSDLSRVCAVVLETDGSFSVITGELPDDRQTLENVNR